jgi:phosphocarrier protein
MAKKTSPSREKSSGQTAGTTPSKSCKKVYPITNELGFHARAAAQFVKIASRYQSEVTVKKDSREVNGKSIMGILMLAAPKGSRVEITTEGDDCREALRELGELIENKFGEK